VGDGVRQWERMTPNLNSGSNAGYRGGAQAREVGGRRGGPARLRGGGSDRSWGISFTYSQTIFLSKQGRTFVWEENKILDFL
jgi:hypothetical protein